MKYIKKQKIVEAKQFLATKDSWDNIMEIDKIHWKPGEIGSDTFYVNTLNGWKIANKTDWIVKAEDEFWIETDNAFKKNYKLK